MTGVLPGAAGVVDTPDTLDLPAEAVEDPTGLLLELSVGYLYSAALHTAVRFGIADLLAEGPRTAEDLAAEAELNGSHLYRVLRYLATRGVFREDGEHRFHLTPTAQRLRTGVTGSMRDYVLARGEEAFWLSAARMHESVRTGTTAFEDIYGIPFYDYMAANPENGASFNASMVALSQVLSNAVAATCDLSEAKSAIDIGGGRGGLLKALLTRNPHLTGILFDLESVVAGHVLDTPELTGRWSVEGGDFFTAVPAGADVYLLQHVLASWPDAECVRILRTCREAMPPHGRLLVINALLPEGNAPHPGKAVDMIMLTVLNGRGRTRAEYEALLHEAGFTVSTVTEASPQASILEAAPTP